MVGIINTILAIFLILIVIATFITEPKLSFDYWKAAGKSAKLIVVKIKNFIMEWKDDKKVQENMQEVSQP